MKMLACMWMLPSYAVLQQDVSSVYAAQHSSPAAAGIRDYWKQRAFMQYVVQKIPIQRTKAHSGAPLGLQLHADIGQSLHPNAVSTQCLDQNEDQPPA